MNNRQSLEATKAGDAMTTLLVLFNSFIWVYVLLQIGILRGAI